MAANTSSLVFLGWTKPWVHLLADWLWANPERLRRRLVVVPTRESGRHLREVLVERAVANGCGAILGPRLATPDDFFRPEGTMPDSVRWSGWVHVLRSAEDESVATLFPGGIARKDDNWRVGVAQQIEQARELLASINAGFETVSAALPEEAERWSEAARLERRVVLQWKKWGFADPVKAKRERCQNPIRPLGVDEIILAGIPDPTWLAVEAWKRLAAQGMTFTVLVAAPATMGGAFDEWGRPKPEFWTNRTQHATPEPTEAILAADAGGLAKAVVGACLDKTNREVAIGVCDPTFMPAVSRCLDRAGWVAFDPQGTLLARDGWPELLEAMAGALEGPDDYAAIARVAMHPVVWRRRLGANEARGCFAALEDWEKKNAATDATRVIQQLGNGAGRPALQAARRLLEQVHSLIHEELAGKTSPLEKCLRQWLKDEAPELVATADAEMAGWACLDHQAFGLPLRWRWLAATLSAVSQPADSSAAHVALQGWLELLFEPAPHLILAGVHEGCVPEAPAYNSLVSEVVREKLGLRDRKSRLAREVFLYTAMVESRRQGGSVTVITAQTNPQGEPCKPSRVLLQASMEDLPKRVLSCMTRAAHLPLEATPAWSRGKWLLRVPKDAKPNKTWSHLSPSTLKAYLVCPTRFYFSRVLGWEDFEPFSQELDGAGFGDLLHQVFRRWAADSGARELTEGKKLKACWRELLEEETKNQFGARLSPLLRLQVMSAAERLNALADHQAEQCRQGWHIVEFEKDYKGILHLAGVPIEMRVDRIDRHEDCQRVRIVDYKTAKKGTAPRKTHLRTWPQEVRPEPLGPLLTFKKGCGYGWADLQLPLYALAVQKAMNLQTVPEAWYALLPEAVSQTEFNQFKELGEVIGNAQQWAEEAARRIINGVFWPPAAQVKYDDFEAIAPEGLQKALGQEWAEFLAGNRDDEGTAV
jgi:ATP-dependent helicase/nuclease subunit B